MKKAVIVGAGVGGIATGTYLAREGFNVTIFEKNAFPGGRCASFTKDGHRFDIGATLLMMLQVYERTFSDFGKNLFEELDLVRMDPVYRLKYPDQTELHGAKNILRNGQQLDRLPWAGFSRGSFIQGCYRNNPAFPHTPALFSYLVHIIRDFQKDQLNNLNYFSLDILEKNKLTVNNLGEIARGASIPGGFRNVIRESVLESIAMFKNPSLIFT